jgi:hypothetical protein
MKRSLLLSAIVLCVAAPSFKVIDDKTAHRRSASREDYLEECQHEGCNSEELSEMCSSYTEECIGEGCSKEEVIELAGSPSSVAPMFLDLKRHGCNVRDSDFVAGNCTGIKTDTTCVLVTLWCKDFYSCPDGNLETSWYICGGCIGTSSTGCSTHH